MPSHAHRNFLHLATLISVYLISACSSAPPKAQAEPPSVAKLAHPIVMTATASDGKIHTIRVESNTWWTDGGRGVSVGRKTINAGLPYLFFINPGILASTTKFAIRPLGETALEVNLARGSPYMQMNVPSLGFKTDRAFFAVCPPDLAKPERSDCLYTDNISFQISTDGGAPISGRNQNITSFLVMARKILGPGAGSVNFNGLDGSTGRQKWQLVEDAQVERRQQRALQEELRRSAEAKNAKAADARYRASLNAQDQFLRSAPRGTALICDSGDELLIDGGSLSRLTFRCSMPHGAGHINLEEVLNSGWAIENQVLSPSQSITGRMGHTVNVVLRKNR